jgi:ribonuclease Z
VPDAARTAARTGVGTLVLTHMVPPVQPGAEHEWIEQAQAEFGGTVVLSDDLTAVEVVAAVQ